MPLCCWPVKLTRGEIARGDCDISLSGPPTIRLPADWEESFCVSVELLALSPLVAENRCDLSGESALLQTPCRFLGWGGMQSGLSSTCFFPPCPIMVTTPSYMDVLRYRDSHPSNRRFAD